MTSEWHGGKGSKRRPEDKKKFDENWDKIFGKKDDKDSKINNKDKQTLEKNSWTKQH